MGKISGAERSRVDIDVLGAGDGRMKVLVIGATSAIATSLARQLAIRGCSFLLAARNETHLAAVASDLVARGAGEIETCRYDADEPSGSRMLLGLIEAKTIDLCVLAHGVLPDQNAIQDDSREIGRVAATNGVSVISLLGFIGSKLEKQGSGTILVFSSVAGLRGRRSNYVYGSAKAMVNTFSEGLRMRLAGRGVQVTTALIGMVDTPMTRSFSKGPLWSTPEKVAKRILTAIDKGEGFVYAPWFWRYIMLVVRCLPEVILRRLPV